MPATVWGSIGRKNRDQRSIRTGRGLAVKPLIVNRRTNKSVGVCKRMPRRNQPNEWAAIGIDERGQVHGDPSYTPVVSGATPDHTGFSADRQKKPPTERPASHTGGNARP